MKYKTKPIIIEASQWFKNGDHPNDFDKGKCGFEKGELRTWTGAEVKANGWEGQVVRYYRNPNGDGLKTCALCNQIMHDHGWIDFAPDVRTVCPGDWIVTSPDGHYLPLKPDIFSKHYEPEE